MNSYTLECLQSEWDNDRGYNVHDVLNAEYTLEPLICLYCGSKEVTFHQYIGDAHCGDCGKWQVDE